MRTSNRVARCFGRADRIRLLVLPLTAACFILTAGCDRDEAPPPEPTVSGTVTSREPLSLPAAATLELRLARTSDDGEQDELLAVQRQRDVGALPVHFTLQYAPAAVDPTRRYTVTARVLLGDDVLLESERALPVLTRGASNHVQLELVPADPDTTGLRPGEPTVVTYRTDPQRLVEIVSAIEFNRSGAVAQSRIDAVAYTGSTPSSSGVRAEAA